MNHCVRETADAGYCSRGCLEAQDCMTGFSHCEESKDQNACRADWEKGPEGCGRAPGNEEGVGKPCATDTDCAQGFCAVDIVTPLAPFCTRECDSSEDCGPEALCLSVVQFGQTICVPEACTCLESGDPESLRNKGLEAMQLHACSLIYDRERFAYLDPGTRYDPMRLPHFNPIHHYPLRQREFAEELILNTDSAAQGNTTLAAQITEGAKRLGYPLSNTSPGTSETSQATLEESLVAFLQAIGEETKLDDIQASIEPLPLELHAPIGRILMAMSAFPAARSEALGPTWNTKSQKEFLYKYAGGGLLYRPDFQSMSFAVENVLNFASGEFDYAKMYTSARKLALVVEEIEWPAGMEDKEFHIHIPSSAGAIILSDSRDHTYQAEDVGTKGIALLVDLGGNDIYRVPVGANLSPDNLISLAIDLGGNDIYTYEKTSSASETPRLLADDGSGRFDAQTQPDMDSGPMSFSDTPRQGAGRLGIGMLFDMGEGSDTYESLRMSQGFALLGVGALVDAGGSDEYRCESGCQGSAYMGIGVLHDKNTESDQFLSWQYSQGFAHLMGYGMLFEDGGNDLYECVIGGAGDYIYYSPQMPGTGNSSMCQGFGFGRRADFSDGVSLSGGLGILRDQSGDDSYTADVFNQGGGYWFGTGVLADGSGDDHYFGRYYTQAIGAHFALGMLIDGSGNDVHNEDNAPVSSIGFAHDASTTLFWDKDGDDLYRGGGIRGYDSGFSIFIEEAGNDQYLDCNTLGAASLGSYGSTTPNMLSVGFFVDAQGNDLYDIEAPAGLSIGEGMIWIWKDLPETLPGEHGVGIDGEGTTGF